MKKLFFILFFTALIFGANAQGGKTPPRSWELIGNTGTTSRNFLGTPMRHLSSLKQMELKECEFYPMEILG